MFWDPGDGFEAGWWRGFQLAAEDRSVPAGEPPTPHLGPELAFVKHRIAEFHTGNIKVGSAGNPIKSVQILNTCVFLQGDSFGDQFCQVFLPNKSVLMTTQSLLSLHGGHSRIMSYLILDVMEPNPNSVE